MNNDWRPKIRYAAIAVGILLFAYLLALDEAFRLSTLGILSLPALFYVVVNKLLGREYRKRDVVIIVVVMAFTWWVDICEYWKWERIVATVSIVLIGWICLWRRESLGRRCASLAIFAIVTFLIPSWCLLGCEYWGVYYSFYRGLRNDIAREVVHSADKSLPDVNLPEEEEQEVTAATEVKTLPERRIINEGENQVAYFDLLRRYAGAQVWTHRREDGDTLCVWEAVEMLDEYARGKRMQYPREEVYTALQKMSIEQGWMESHGVDEPVGEGGMNRGEIFMFNFMKQIARYCPRIDLLADIYTEDGNAGIIKLASRSEMPFYSFLLHRTDAGFKAEMIGDQYTDIQQLHQLKDRKGNLYYLCLTEDAREVYLYQRKGQRIKRVYDLFME